MLYNIIYSIIFIIIMSVLFWILAEEGLNNVSTTTVEYGGVTYEIPQFDFGKRDPKMIKSTGSFLACESLYEITGQKIKYNNIVPGSKSVVSNKSILVDCFDSKNNIMVDYKPREFFTYNGPDHVNDDVYEFYDRLALDAQKKESLSKTNNKYIEIPYLVDNCYKKDDNWLCSSNVPHSLRKKRIKNYLKEKIIEIY